MSKNLLNKHLNLGYLLLMTEDIVINDPFGNDSKGVCLIENINQGEWDVFIVMNSGKVKELVIKFRFEKKLKRIQTPKWQFYSKIYLSKQIVGIFNEEFYQKKENDIWYKIIVEQQNPACKFYQGVAVQMFDLGFHNIYLDIEQGLVIGVKIVNK